MVGAIPKVMVGVDDRQLGIEDRFLRLLGEPGVVWRFNPAPELAGLLRHSDAPCEGRRAIAPAAMIAARRRAGQPTGSGRFGAKRSS
jgi:hypothetical protein